MTLKKSQSSGPEADTLILGLANAVTVHPVCQEGATIRRCVNSIGGEYPSGLL